MTQSATAASVHSTAAAAVNAAQYLTFLCAGEEYGVEILRVQEIKGWEHVTRVPYVSPYVRGVMNLRGMIVPVIDLRGRFGLDRRTPDASTVVIVVRVGSARGDKTVGIVVDGVSDVYSFEADAIKAPPELGPSASGLCVKGIATVDHKLVMLLDIDGLVNECVESVPQGRLSS